ncbi:MAG: HAMP domain-containing histidine kinase, partial [Proteobacteria bacterium]
PRLSLSVCLAALWAFTFSIAVALGVVVYQAYEQGPGSQIRLASQSAEKACSELSSKFSWGVENKSFSIEKKADFQYALLEIILEHYEGVEGGYWFNESFGPYAFPTYEGNGVKRDIPSTETPTLNRLAKGASQTLLIQRELKQGTREAVFSVACPITLREMNAAAWTMIRIPLSPGFAYRNYQWSLTLLFLLLFVSGISLSLIVHRWVRNVRSLERQILEHSVDSLPPIQPNPEKELNRIVVAMNQLNLRLQQSKAETKSLELKLSHNDRLSALGKMAAEMAHEIRNPLATIHLKFENALVAPAERMPLAAPVIYDQIQRIDRLIHMLLAMTQQFEVKAQLVLIEDWLERLLVNVRKSADAKGVQLKVDNHVNEWSFDPFHLARALENLLSNAIAFAQDDGVVHVRLSIDESHLVIDVEDDGPGISAAIRETLFQPFKTNRMHGTGLGLILVDDIARAHGGRVKEIAANHGAMFRLEIPWQKS